MIIEVARVPSEGKRYQGEEDVSILEISDDENLRPRGGIQYDLTVQVAIKDVIITGSLELEVEHRCSRCAQFFTVQVADRSFHRMYELDDLSESVDLTQDIRESMILAFPSYPVCSRECKGLCPHCGKNLNTGPCECGPAKDDRWGALDDLKL